jgi:hypothetical protein
VRALTAHETIVEMLRSYNEVCGPGERGEGSDPSDDRVLMMNPLWSQGSYAELYRCLYEMRNEELALYWHVAERYLRLRHRRTIGCPECRLETRDGVRHTHFANGARTRFERQPFLQEVWDPRVDLRKVDAGVDWLVREHRGTPYLPGEIFLLVAS